MKNKNTIFSLFLLLFIAVSFFVAYKNIGNIKLNIFKPLFETVTVNISKDKSKDTFLTVNGQVLNTNFSNNTYKAVVKNTDIRTIKLHIPHQTPVKLPEIFLYKDTDLKIIRDYSDKISQKEYFEGNESFKAGTYDVYDLSDEISGPFEHIKSLTFSGYYNAAMIALLGLFQCNFVFILPILMLFGLLWFYGTYRREIVLFDNINLYGVGIVIIAAAGILLRFNGINNDPLWYDEYYTVFHYGNPELPFSLVYSDPGNPPFYFIFVRLWTVLCGSGVFSIRILPFVVGIYAVIMLYDFLKEFVGKNAAVVGLFLVAVNSYYIFYSQEVRSYGLLMLLTPMCAYFLFRIIKKGETKDYILYTLVSIIAANTHYYETFVCVFNFVFGTVLLLKTGQTEKIKKFVTSNIIALSSFAVFFAIRGIQALIDQGCNAWIEPLSIDAVQKMIIGFFGYYPVFIIFMLTAFGVFRYRSDIEAKFSDNTVVAILFYCFLLIVTLFTFVFAFSAYKSILVFRYFMSVYPLFIIFTAIIVSYFFKINAKYAAIALLIVFAGTFNSPYFQCERKSKICYLEQVSNLAYFDFRTYLKTGKKGYVMSADNNIFFPKPFGKFYKHSPEINYVNDVDFESKCREILNSTEKFVLYTDINIKDYPNKTEIYNAATEIPVYIYTDKSRHF